MRGVRGIWCLLFGFASSAFAVSDDFDRASGTDLGPNWNEVSGDWQILANRLAAPASGLLIFNGASFARPLVSAVAISQTTMTEYAALISNYADPAHCVFVKVQGQNGTGAFNRAYFYYGYQGGPWPGMTGGPDNVELPTAFAAARIALQVLGSEVTLLIDKDFDGSFEESFTRGGLPTALLGTGVGLGALGGIWIDSFSATNIENAPTLTLKGRSSIKTSKSKITLKGTASDAGGDLAAVEVKVGKGKFKRAAGTSNWRFKAKLKSGRNVLQIRARDDEMHTSKTVRVKVTRV